MNRNQMLEKRNNLLQKADELVAAAEAEDRNLSAEETTTYQDLVSEVEDLDQRMERVDALELRKGLHTPADQTTPPDEDPNIGLTKKEAREFSMVRAIRAVTAGTWAGAGFEKECSDAVAEKLGKEPRSFYIPHDVLMATPETRAVNITKAGEGAELVGETLMASSFIGLLRNRLMVKAAGARTLTGLVGDLAIPVQDTGASGTWLADEDTAASTSTYTFSQRTLSPKTVSAWIGATRTMTMQATPDIEMLMRDDLANALSTSIDLAALHGAGTGGAPTGVAATSGIGSVAGGTNGLAPTWGHIVELETDVAVANADLGAMSYLTNAKVRGKLKTTETVSGSGQFVWGVNTNTLNGYRALVSNQVSSGLTKGTASGVCSAIFFGNWADLIIGMWGGLDLLVDPFTNSTKGQILVIAFQSVDLTIRHPASFSAMLDALTA